MPAQAPLKLARLVPAVALAAGLLMALPSAARAAETAPCVPDATTLCLNASRFKVQVAWSVPSQGTSGAGNGVALTGDTGEFWFFSANNIEIVVKVVDGRPFNGKFWVFIGSLTDVDYRVTIRDLDTGRVNTYVHEAGTLQSFSDTAAF